MPHPARPRRRQRRPARQHLAPALLRRRRQPLQPQLVHVPVWLTPFQSCTSTVYVPVAVSACSCSVPVTPLRIIVPFGSVHPQRRDEPVPARLPRHQPHPVPRLRHERVQVVPPRRGQRPRLRRPAAERRPRRAPLRHRRQPLQPQLVRPRVRRPGLVVHLHHVGARRPQRQQRLQPAHRRRVQHRNRRRLRVHHHPRREPRVPARLQQRHVHLVARPPRRTCSRAVGRRARSWRWRARRRRAQPEEVRASRRPIRRPGRAPAIRSTPLERTIEMQPRRETVNHPERMNDAMPNASFPAV